MTSRIQRGQRNNENLVGCKGGTLKISLSGQLFPLLDEEMWGKVMSSNRGGGCLGDAGVSLWDTGLKKDAQLLLKQPQWPSETKRNASDLPCNNPLLLSVGSIPAGGQLRKPGKWGSSNLQ